MKKIIIVVVLLIGTVGFAQNRNAKGVLEVDGICNMCKKRIETASIKIKGVKAASWSVKTHKLKLVYNEKKTNLEAVKKRMVAIGHDTDGLIASDAAYNKLHACCKYRDQKVKDAHKN